MAATIMIHMKKLTLQSINQQFQREPFLYNIYGSTQPNQVLFTIYNNN